MVSLITLIIIAVISNTLYYTALFLLGFIPLRMFAGGFHAGNHLKCYLILVSVYILFLVALLSIPGAYIIYTIVPCSLSSLLLVFLFAPSEDMNKQISINDALQLRKGSRILIIGYTIIIGVLLTIPNMKIAFSMSIGIFTVSLSLLANWMRYKKSKTSENIMSGEEVRVYEKV